MRSLSISVCGMCQEMLLFYGHMMAMGMGHLQLDVHTGVGDIMYGYVWSIKGVLATAMYCMCMSKLKYMVQ